MAYNPASYTFIVSWLSTIHIHLSSSCLDISVQNPSIPLVRRGPAVATAPMAQLAHPLRQWQLPGILVFKKDDVERTAMDLSVLRKFKVQTATLSRRHRHRHRHFCGHHHRSSPESQDCHPSSTSPSVFQQTSRWLWRVKDWLIKICLWLP